MKLKFQWLRKKASSSNSSSTHPLPLQPLDQNNSTTPLLHNLPRLLLPPKITLKDMISKYKGGVNERVSLTEILLNRLELREKWKAKRNHSCCVDVPILAEHEDVDLWEMLRENIVCSTSECAFIVDKTKGFSKNSTATKFKKYSALKSKHTIDLCQIAPRCMLVAESKIDGFCLKWKNNIFILAHTFTIIVY